MPFGTTTQSAITSQHFLRLDGIDGPSPGLAEGHTDPSFVVVQAMWSILHHSKAATSGVHLGSGLIESTPYKVVILDNQTTGIFTAFTNGTIIKTVTTCLTQRLGEKVVPLFTVTLTNARMTSFEQKQWVDVKERKDQYSFLRHVNPDGPGTPDNGSVVLELDFVPEDIKVAYSPAGTDGTVAGDIAQSYNLKTAAIS